VTERSELRAERRETAPAAGPDAGHVLLVALVLALAGISLWLAGDILLVIFAGILIAVGLDGLASGLSRQTGLPRTLALVVTSLALLAGLAGLAVLVVPRVVGQIDQITELFSTTFEAARATLNSWGWPEDVVDVAEVDQDRIMDLAGGVAGRVAGMTMTAIGILGSLFVVIAIALFTAYDPALYRRGFVALLPSRRRGRVEAALSSVGHSLRWWFFGQLVSMMVLAVTVSGGLWLIGVELWLSLGVLTGVLTFIPILGPVIAGVPILIVAFAEGISTGLSVLVFYLVIQNLEGNLLVPFIQQKAVRLPPTLLISTQILLGALLGVLGFILAAPLAVVGMVVVQRLYLRPDEGSE
jgi:predicted PurR-regulated permease PerM